MARSPDREAGVVSDRVEIEPFYIHPRCGLNA